MCCEEKKMKEGSWGEDLGSEYLFRSLRNKWKYLK